MQTKSGNPDPQDNGQRVIVPEVLPPEPPAPAQPQPQPAAGEGPSWLTRKRLLLAFGVAVVSDAISFWLALVPPAQWAVDVGTALLLFSILGWQWLILPGLLLEAIPGVYVFPAWVLVVAAVAVYGTARPTLN